MSYGDQSIWKREIQLSINAYHLTELFSGLGCKSSPADTLLNSDNESLESEGEVSVNSCSSKFYEILLPAYLIYFKLLLSYPMLLSPSDYDF